MIMRTGLIKRKRDKKNEVGQFVEGAAVFMLKPSDVPDRGVKLTAPGFTAE